MERSLLAVELSAADSAHVIASAELRGARAEMATAARRAAQELAAVGAVSREAEQQVRVVPRRCVHASLSHGAEGRAATPCARARCVGGRCM